MEILWKLLILPLLFTHSLMAETDWSFAFEGDVSKRARLADLQGSDRLPEIDLSDWMNGDAMTLESLKGKVVVLDFWATWCGPCIRSIPKANALQARHGDDLVIIGICHPKGAEKMKEVVEAEGIRYPVAVDHDREVGEAYQVNSYPDYYVIDQRGKLVVADCKNSQVDEVVARLLGE